MGGYRAERVAALIHKEVAQRLRTEIKDERLVPVSITNVRVNRDLSRAVLSYMPLGGGEVGGDLRRAMTDAARTLRGPVGRALRLRHAPELVFEQDSHTEQAIRVTRLLEELAAERAEDDAGGEDA